MSGPTRDAGSFRDPSGYVFAQGDRIVAGINTLINTSKSLPLLIGSSLQASKSERIFIQGKIDELTIYEGHMDYTAVQELYEYSR